MKFKDIKTTDQLYGLGDIWYKRSGKLLYAYNNTKNLKALRLYILMFNRIRTITSIISNIEALKFRDIDFEIGGVIQETESLIK